MATPRRNNNEFHAAEEELRRIGSHLWFGGLSEEWQDFLRSHTVECFDTYAISLPEAATLIIRVFQILINVDPNRLEQDPWQNGLNEEVFKILQIAEAPISVP